MTANDPTQKILNALQKLRDDTQEFQIEQHQISAAQKTTLQPGSWSRTSNNAMLVIPVGTPTFSKGFFNIGYNTDFSKKWTGSWMFLSEGGAGTEQANARTRLVSKGWWDPDADGPSAEDVLSIREQENSDRDDDGVTTGIILVWVPEVAAKRSVGDLDKDPYKAAMASERHARKARSISQTFDPRMFGALQRSSDHEKDHSASPQPEQEANRDKNADEESNNGGEDSGEFDCSAKFSVASLEYFNDMNPSVHANVAP